MSCDLESGGKKDNREKFVKEVDNKIRNMNKNEVSVVTVATVGSVEAFIPGDCFMSYRDRVEQYSLKKSCRWWNESGVFYFFCKSRSV